MKDINVKNIIKIISKFFSGKFINKSAAEYNPIMIIIYRLAYPVSIFFKILKFTPNQVTFLSLIFAFAAVTSLIFEVDYLFLIFWASSVLLDFCDGTLARMTGKISKGYLCYDHMGDIFKLFLVILGLCIKYNDFYIWIFGLSFIFIYEFYEIISHDIKSLSINIKKSRNASSTGQKKYFQLKKILTKIGFDINSIAFFYKIVRSTLFTLNGHTTLLFLFCIIDKFYVYFIFLYLIVLALLGVYISAKNLMRFEKQ